MCYDLFDWSNDFDCKEFPGSSTCAGLLDATKLRDPGSAVLDARFLFIPCLALVFGAALTSESKDLSVSPLYALQDTPLTGILCGSEKMDDAFPKLHWVSCVEWGSLGCSSDIGLSKHRPNLSELRNIDRNTRKNTALAWVKRCFAISKNCAFLIFTVAGNNCHHSFLWIWNDICSRWCLCWPDVHYAHHSICMWTDHHILWCMNVFFADSCACSVLLRCLHLRISFQVCKNRCSKDMLGSVYRLMTQVKGQCDVPWSDTALHQKSSISIITCPEASGILAVLLTLQIRTMCGWAGYSKVRFL